MDNKEEIIEDIHEEASDDGELLEDNSLDEPKKSKVLPLILLILLLILDISALVIYLIGVEKVISFIK